jgi:hypothetical protein
MSGSRAAIVHDDGNAESTHANGIAALLDGDDTPAVIAWHGILSAWNPGDTIWSVGTSVDSSHYLRLVHYSTSSRSYMEGRGDGDGAAVTALDGPLLSVDTEYTIVVVRKPAAVDIYLNGSLDVGDQAFVVGDLGTLNLGALACLNRAAGESGYSGQSTRRFAVHVGADFTAAQAALLDAAWRSK